MSALSLGTKTLRTLISSPNLSLDHIEETTTALSDALADANDINEAVTSAGQLDSAAEGEVEDELKALIESVEREDQLKKEEAAVEERLAQVQEADRSAEARAAQVGRQQQGSEREPDEQLQAKRRQAAAQEAEKKREVQVEETLDAANAPSEKLQLSRDQASQRTAEPAI